MIFFANKKNGQLTIENRSRLEEYIRALPNCRIVISLKRYRAPRSLDQNDMWHGMCQIIGEDVGMTVEEVKTAIKEKIGLYREISGLRKYLSSADLTTKEFGALVEHTYRIAAEMGIILPTPEEWKAEHDQN